MQSYYFQILLLPAFGFLSALLGYHLRIHTDIVEQGIQLQICTIRVRLPSSNLYYS